MTKDLELVRRGIIAELDAINLYEQMASESTNPKLKKTFLEISYEEKVHAGEFESMLDMLSPEHEKAEQEGEKETGVEENITESNNNKYTIEKLIKDLKKFDSKTPVKAGSDKYGFFEIKKVIKGKDAIFIQVEKRT
jgi:rubrerythrin